MLGILIDEQGCYYERFPLQLQSYEIRQITTNVLMLDFKYKSLDYETCINFKILLTYVDDRYIPSQYTCIVQLEHLQEEIPTSWYSQPVTNWYLFF